MGNNSSTPSNSINSTKINSNNSINSNKNKNTDFDHGVIFDKILNISNDMIMKYKNNFLDPEFCKNIALVYQNKLNELDIKVLRETLDELKECAAEARGKASQQSVDTAILISVCSLIVSIIVTVVIFFK